MSRKAKKVKYEQKTLREKQIDFKRHLRTYLVMSVFFIVLDTISGPGSWAMWPIMGWGIGVAMQALSLYGPLRDPDEAHPTDQEFSGPLPDLRDRPEPLKLRELDARPYRDEDLV
ncbi:2TM domain-containing protein [Neolewinella lacunae]|uniref:2TM domain-containing protein n=1 Tax=Neolewinella lacunae TaxID=1517758 RepID=A0A923PGZ2_9BACT|nr:2TM domain-containing protein [Neolewinella lacunae]MBC6993938.1 2TM domain-containing protein [Neolewinella lacunae]MDN3634981.1 2TM domain-containing protein [Neolewinella lacunae]